jgi:dsDNA-specific endonuclease/ATPase MutS2
MFHTTTLELHLILEKLAAYAVSQKAKEAILKLMPLYDFAGISSRLYEVDEARIIINQKRALPLNPLIQIEKAMDQLSKEPVLNATHLDAIASFLEDVTKLKFALLKYQEECKRISAYGLSLIPCQDLKENIQLSIYQGRIQDQASPKLASVRRRINLTEGQIKDKLASLMKSNSAFLMDAMVVQRNGRYALPIKAEHKKSMEGDILDKSATGQTLYIEPRAVQLLTHQLHMLHIDEEQECLRILSELTNKCAEHEKDIMANIEVMLHCDILFAKARLSFAMDAISPVINDEGVIRLISARHPLLEDKVIPLNITLGETYQGILITGPNTGGKTVAMKTVGLLALMMQCGLHIP